MPALIHQRCFNHAAREAAARCPECARFFCRECVTEHEDRLLCAECVRKLVKLPFRQRKAWLGAVQTVQLFFGVMMAWLFFYWLGQMLLSIDPAVHEGTLWKRHWLDRL